MEDSDIAAFVPNSIITNKHTSENNNTSDLMDDNVSLLAPISVKRPESWLNFGSLLLENKNSVARDHLASERTFLAWLRTSLSLASVGVGVAQLLKLSTGHEDSHMVLRMSKGLGLTFMLSAIICVLIGTIRFFVIQQLLTADEFPGSRLGVFILLSLVISLCVAVFAIVVVVY